MEHDKHRDAISVKRKFFFSNRENLFFQLRRGESWRSFPLRIQSKFSVNNAELSKEFLSSQFDDSNSIGSNQYKIVLCLVSNTIPIMMDNHALRWNSRVNVSGEKWRFLRIFNILAETADSIKTKSKESKRTMLLDESFIGNRRCEYFRNWFQIQVEICASLNSTADKSFRFQSSAIFFRSIDEFHSIRSRTRQLSFRPWKRVKKNEISFSFLLILRVDRFRNRSQNLRTQRFNDRRHQNGQISRTHENSARTFGSSLRSVRWNCADRRQQSPKRFSNHCRIQKSK